MLRRVGPGYGKWPDVLVLIQTSFAYMEARLGAPSPAAKLTASRLARDAAEGAVFIVEAEARPVACLFSRPSRDWPDAYYIGKLAVDAPNRGKGLARALIGAAEAEARRLGFPRVVLDTGAELTELHRAFTGLGFDPIEPADAAMGGVVTLAKTLA